MKALSTLGYRIFFTREGIIMEIRRAKEQDMDGINHLLMQVCLVHHKGRPDLFKYGAKKYTDEELLNIIQDDMRPIFIAVDEKKNVYQVVGHDAYSGESIYLPVKDLSAFLSELRNSRGVETNIDVTAYRTVPVSTVIEIFDQCQIQGFTHTRVRLGSKPY